METRCHGAELTVTASFAAFRDQLLTALKSGDIDMSLLDDTKTFDLVISIVESALRLKTGNG